MFANAHVGIELHVLREGGLDGHRVRAAHAEIEAHVLERRGWRDGLDRRRSQAEQGAEVATGGVGDLVERDGAGDGAVGGGSSGLHVGGYHDAEARLNLETDTRRAGLNSES